MGYLLAIVFAIASTLGLPNPTPCDYVDQDGVCAIMLTQEEWDALDNE